MHRFHVYPEDDQWVGECSCGVASCGDTRAEALAAVVEADALFREVAKSYRTSERAWARLQWRVVQAVLSWQLLATVMRRTRKVWPSREAK